MSSAWRRPAKLHGAYTYLPSYKRTFTTQQTASRCIPCDSRLFSIRPTALSSRLFGRHYGPVVPQYDLKNRYKQSFYIQPYIHIYVTILSRAFTNSNHCAPEHVTADSFHLCRTSCSGSDHHWGWILWHPIQPPGYRKDLE